MWISFTVIHTFLIGCHPSNRRNPLSDSYHFAIQLRCTELQANDFISFEIVLFVCRMWSCDFNWFVILKKKLNSFGLQQWNCRVSWQSVSRAPSLGVWVFSDTPIYRTIFEYSLNDFLALTSIKMIQTLLLWSKLTLFLLV